MSRPVNLQAEYDARGADDERATDPGAYRAPRPARPTVSRWRPTRYVSCDDGATWLRHTMRGWTYRPVRVRGRRAVAHHAAAAAARPPRLAWIGDAALLAAVAALAAVAWIVTPI